MRGKRSVSIAVLTSLFTFSMMLASPALGIASVKEPEVGSFKITLLAPPADCQPNWVHIYHWTGQPINRWENRVVGTDLLQLVNDTAGKAFIVINDEDGSHSYEIPFDEGHPLNALFALNGPHPQILVSITNSQNRYTGCYSTFNLTYS